MLFSHVHVCTCIQGSLAQRSLVEVVQRHQVVSSDRFDRYRQCVLRGAAGVCVCVCVCVFVCVWLVVLLVMLLIVRLNTCFNSAV